MTCSGFFVRQTGGNFSLASYSRLLSLYDRLQDGPILMGQWCSNTSIPGTAMAKDHHSRYWRVLSIAGNSSARLEARRGDSPAPS